MKFCMVGCNHRQSPLAVRERLAFSDEQARRALVDWRTAHPETEAVVLSTCNRVELYAASDEASLSSQQLIEHLARCHQTSPDQLQGELEIFEGDEVAGHLFRVATSLDSMVVGEPQILSQVKQAYELARQTEAAGPLLHSLFQSALRVARRVASETSLHRHRVSIPSIAIADFAARVFEQFDDKQIVLLGAGKMAGETLRYLVDAGAKRIVVITRDEARGQGLATQFGGVTAPWESRWEHLVAADLVISTTGAEQPVVTLEDYRGQIAPGQQQRPWFVLDLAVPRDFEPAIGDELGVFLYAIDDLAEACRQNAEARSHEFPAVEQIIGEESRQFAADMRHRISAPVIALFREGLEASQRDELERLFHKLPELDAPARREIAVFADRLVNKLLHPPLASLRDESQNGSPHGLLEALKRLFQLKE
jgi:glutamyl-tRNA reductase